MKIHTALTITALLGVSLAVFADAGPGAPDKALVEQGGVQKPKSIPTREDAITFLGQVQDARKNGIVWQHQRGNVAYEMAILLARSMPAENRPADLRYTLLFHRSPDWTGKQYMHMARGSLPGILTLAGTLPETGSWRPAKELEGQESVCRWAAYHGVKADACYGFTDRNGGRLLMHWNGDELSILCMEFADPNKAFGSATKRFLELVEEGDADASLLAYTIGDLGPYAAPAIPYFTTLLKSKKIEERLLAARNLWKIDRNKEVSLSVLSQAFLQAEDPKIQPRVAIFLSEMGPAAMPWYGKLEAYLEDPDLYTRAAMAYGLWLIDPSRGEPKAALRKIILNTGNEIYFRERACEMMARISPAELREILLKRIEAPDETDAFKKSAENMAHPVGFIAGVPKKIEQQLVEEVDAKVGGEKNPATDPEWVAKAFITALANKNVYEAAKYVIPAERDSFKKELEKGIPPWPKDPQVQIKIKDNGIQADVSLLNGQKPASGPPFGFDMRLSEGKWWIGEE